jgi:tRNA (guanine-N7-)-methyltransferase
MPRRPPSSPLQLLGTTDHIGGSRHHYAGCLLLAAFRESQAMRPNLRVKRKLIVEPIGLTAEELLKPTTGLLLFGNEHPLELEIGAGKGTFMTDQAKARPDVNFLGLEKARKYWMYAADRLRRNGCLNARMILGDASAVVSEILADASLSAVHVYFPDPWPKKRHHKRRLIQRSFLEQVERVLEPGGRLQIVTDYEDYYQHIEYTVRESQLTETEYSTPGSAGEGEIVGTNFERKYRREGRPFYAIAATKE